jgi:hypothetical protein
MDLELAPEVQMFVVNMLRYSAHSELSMMGRSTHKRTSLVGLFTEINIQTSAHFSNNFMF